MKLSDEQIKAIEELTNLKYQKKHNYFTNWSVVLEFNSTLTYFIFGDMEAYEEQMPTKWLIPLGKILGGK